MRSGLKPKFGKPLNQYGLPAASLEPATFVPVGPSSVTGFLPLAGMSTLWNAVAVNLTESPTWIVALCGKKSIASVLSFGSMNFFCASGGRPS